MLFDKPTEESIQLLAHRGIQADEGIIDDEHLGLLDQVLKQLITTHLATRQQHHALLEQRAHHESVQQRIGQEFGIVLGTRLTRLLFGQTMSCSTRLVGRKSCSRYIARCQSAFQYRRHQRRFVSVLRVETLLEIIRFLDRPQGILKSQLDNIAIRRRRHSRPEIISQRALHQQVLACQQVNEATLAPSVGTHDGDMFALLETEVDGFCHARLGHSAQRIGQ